MAYLGKTPSQAVRSRYYFTATGGETSLSGADDNSNVLAFSDGNYVDVSLNGVALVAGTDYNTTTANTIGGLTALVASDVIEVIVYDTFSVFSGNVNSNFSVGGDLSVTGTSSFGNNIDVTGTITSDGLTVDTADGSLQVSSGFVVDLTRAGTNYIRASDASGGLRLGSGSGYNRLDVASNGDISFYDSAGTTQGLFWDASTQHLGLGTTSPDRAIKIHRDNAYLWIADAAGGNVAFMGGSGENDGLMRLYEGAGHVAKVEIHSDADSYFNGGNVGIGTASPSDELEIYDSNNTARIRLSGAGNSSNGVQLGFVDSTTGVLTNTENGAFIFGTNNTERARITSGGNVGIGTTSPSEVLDVNGVVKSSNTFQSTSNRTEGAGWQYNSTTMGYSSDNNYGWITAAGASGRTNLALNAGGGKVGIGTSSPTKTLSVHGNDGSPLYLQGSGNDTAIVFAHSGTVNSAINASSDGALEFRVSGSGAVNEAGRFDASGNLLVGTTDTALYNNSTTGTGFHVAPSGWIETAATGTNAIFNKLSSDGTIAEFRKDGSVVGSIGSDSSYPYFQSASNVGLTMFSYVQPRNNGSAADNIVDLGSGSFRFDDIYATNATIQTSDQNEKQQIASLTDAEITAAKAISQLFKTFKWNSSVTERGDAARTHTGVIAQDVEAAMTAAGLDAGDYAFFISADWYVDADGNEVEADAEGAIAKNRKGIRYPELLSFVGAATEQRLANIETRLAALENA